MAASAEIDQCKKDIASLQEQLLKLRGLDESERGLGPEPLREHENAPGPCEWAKNIKQRKHLKGHFGKIYALQWCSDSKHVVSASQDGKLIVWNGMSTNKIHSIPLRSSWVMTCAYSPSGNLVACGGLDNLCSVYKLQTDTGTAPITPNRTYAELAQHEGYLSCCRFISDGEILTSSGDSTCILWDVEMKTPKAIFSDHNSDVMTVAVTETGNTNCFISGSCDVTDACKLWDCRQKQGCVMSFQGHESDVNSVQWFPDGYAFGTGSDDSTCRLFDSRAMKQLAVYKTDKILCGITSVDFSKSGALMFAGYDDYSCLAWDTVSNNSMYSGVLDGHENRVSCLNMSKDGKAVCTGSWDTNLKIWC